MAIDTYPRRFGKYALIAPLARGGMGELHIGVSGEVDLRKPFVIKQLIGHLASEEYVQRFADESALMVKLSHGNLVPVFEAGVIEGQYYLVMELIEGKDLRSIWNVLQQAEQQCPLDISLHIAREICRGLHYAHTHTDLKLVHRDVSPPNVLLSYSGEVKLADFGLAFSSIKLGKTAPGVLFGKLPYMSPEQARNDPVDARSDIYSTGIILWELLTGERLFPPEGSQLDQLTRAANPKISPPSKIDPELAALDPIVMRALAIDREQRYQTAEEMRGEIAEYLASVAPTTDAAALQAWLSELLGNEKIATERAERERLLNDAAETIQRMFHRSGEAELLDSGMVEAPTGDDQAEGRRRLQTTPPALTRGIVLGGRYRIDALLREGGMGTVYLATHIGIDKQVAIKVLHPAYTSMPEVVSRFRREAKAASRIGHPNIIEVFDSGTTEDGSIYFVMEHLEGQDLADLLADVHMLDINRALGITVQVCQAVSAAHEANIVHRDLKPENVFLTTRDGRFDFVKVLDFGIAQMDPTLHEQLTMPGTPLGTPEYMAPEQAAGVECDHRVDVFATGAMLYEMLTGITPHHGESAIEVFTNKNSKEPVESPRVRRPEVTEELEALVIQALSHEPEQRQQTMSELAYELKKLTSGRAEAVASILGIPEESRRHVVQPADGERALPAQAAARRLLPWIVLGSIGLIALTVTLVLLVSSGIQPPQSPSLRQAGPSATTDGSVDQTRPDTAVAVADTQPRQSLVQAGRNHLRQGRFEKARNAFKAASHSPRQRIRALIGLAELAFQRGRFEEARKHAKAAVAKGGGLQAELILGNVYFKLRRYHSAIDMYKRVLSRNSAQQEARRNLEAAQRQLGQ